MTTKNTTSAFSKARRAAKGPYLVAAATVVFSLYGCGPGSPIMTAEQEAYTRNIDMLMEKTPALERKVEELEARSAGSAAESASTAEMAEVRSIAEKTRAEVNADMELLREDMGRLQGSFEEQEFDFGALKATMAKLSKSLGYVTAKLNELEKKGAATPPSSNADADAEATDDAISSIGSSLTTLEEAVTELKASLAAIESDLGGDMGASYDTRNITDALDVIKTRLTRLEQGGPATEEAAERRPDPAELYMRGYKETMETKDYDSALDTFREFLSLYPAHELSDNAQYWVGELYYAKGDWERAILEFNKVIKGYPAGDKVADALLKQGFAFEKLGDKETAATILERIVEEYPGTESAAKARKRLDSFEGSN